MIRQRQPQVHATCHGCETDVIVPAGQVRLTVLTATWTLECPLCGQIVTRPVAGPLQEDALLAAGVQVCVE